MELKTIAPITTDGFEPSKIGFVHRITNLIASSVTMLALE